jgi:hypothetical protein
MCIILVSLWGGFRRMLHGNRPTNISTSEYQVCFRTVIYLWTYRLYYLYTILMCMLVPCISQDALTCLLMNCFFVDDIKFELHVLLVEHGKVCGACSKGGRAKTKSHACPLAAVKRRSTSKQHVKVNSSTDGAPTQPPKGSDKHDKKRQRLLLGEDE